MAEMKTVATLSCGCRAKVWRVGGFWQGRIEYDGPGEECTRSHSFLDALLHAWLSNVNSRIAENLRADG